MTTHTYNAANRLTARARSDGHTYTYDWSARGQLLTEWTQGYPVRTFSYDAAGRMVEATVFTLTTRFTYNGDGARLAVEVVGHGTTTYTLDYAAGNRILAEKTLTSTTTYLYGHDCLGQFTDADDEWLYYLNDGSGYVRQGTDEGGQVVSGWLFDPDGTLLERPVSHLICGGVYDWSTGLIHKDGGYFDPLLGIWLALMPLVVVQSWRGRKRKRRGFPWPVLLVVVGGVLTACEGQCTPTSGPPIRCSDLTLHMSFGPETDIQPKWNNDLGVYGKKTQIVIRPDVASFAKLTGEDLDKKCKVVQWVEGWREMDGQRIEGFDNENVYVIDKEEPKTSPDYEATPNFGPPDYVKVVSLTLTDFANHPVSSGQTLKVREHYITAVYNAEDLASLPFGQEPGDPTKPKPVETKNWDFVGTYTCP